MNAPIVAARLRKIRYGVQKILVNWNLFGEGDLNVIFQGENVSIYTYYKNVYNEDGLKWTLKIFYCKIKVWCWNAKQNKNAQVYLFKEKMRRM